jgi:hypothetical protein
VLGVRRPLRADPSLRSLGGVPGPLGGGVVAGEGVRPGEPLVQQCTHPGSGAGACDPRPGDPARWDCSGHSP